MLLTYNLDSLSLDPDVEWYYRNETVIKGNDDLWIKIN